MKISFFGLPRRLMEIHEEATSIKSSSYAQLFQQTVARYSEGAILGQLPGVLRAIGVETRHVLEVMDVVLRIIPR